jgi:ABC-2 type transport system permease protein
MISFAVAACQSCTKTNWFDMDLFNFFIRSQYMGGLFQFPERVGELSPFGYIPKLPLELMDFTKVSTLTVIALVLTVISFIGYKNRSIHVIISLKRKRTILIIAS